MDVPCLEERGRQTGRLSRRWTEEMRTDRVGDAYAEWIRSSFSSASHGTLRVRTVRQQQYFLEASV